MSRWECPNLPFIDAKVIGTEPAYFRGMSRGILARLFGRPMLSTVDVRGRVVVETLSFEGSATTPPFTAVLSYDEEAASRARGVRSSLRRMPAGEVPPSLPDGVTLDLFAPLTRR